MTSPKSDFSVRDNIAKQRFEIDLGGGHLAIAQYRIDGDTIAFTHTAVPPAFEGQGVGSALARFALDAARERKLKVIPACAFFVTYVKRHKNFQDLLTKDARGELGLP